MQYYAWLLNVFLTDILKNLKNIYITISAIAYVILFIYVLL